MAPEPQLRMKRLNLEGLPAFPNLPNGYALRSATSEDGIGIGRVLGVAFEDVWTLARVHKDLFDDPGVPETFVVEANNEIIATASYQVQDGFDGSGWVHWVGALPAFKGKGLGKIVSLAALHAAVKAGKKDAYLTTDDFRLPAIRTYLSLGFEPDCWHESHSARWEAVFAALRE